MDLAQISENLHKYCFEQEGQVMNNVILIGRLTRAPEIKKAKTESQTDIATFTLAVDRPFSKNKTADFIRIAVFGKQADNCMKYLSKGRQIGIHGQIRTDSYMKDGQKKYSTSIIARRVEFLGKRTVSTENTIAVSQDVGTDDEEDSIEALISNIDQQTIDEIVGTEFFISSLFYSDESGFQIYAEA